MTSLYLLAGLRLLNSQHLQPAVHLHHSSSFKGLQDCLLPGVVRHCGSPPQLQPSPWTTTAVT